MAEYLEESEREALMKKLFPPKAERKNETREQGYARKAALIAWETRKNQLRAQNQKPLKQKRKKL